MNNKGFTLIELLAVLVILTAIMGIALPSITSTMERSKGKQNQSRQKLLISAAELYVTDHKNAIYKDMATKNTTKCFITISSLQTEGYATDDAVQDADGNDMVGYIIFTKPNTYEYSTTNSGIVECKIG